MLIGNTVRLSAVLVDATNLLRVGRELFLFRVLFDRRFVHPAARYRDDRHLVEDLRSGRRARKVGDAAVVVFTAAVSHDSITRRVSYGRCDVREKELLAEMTFCVC